MLLFSSEVLSRCRGIRNYIEKSRLVSLKLRRHLLHHKGPICAAVVHRGLDARTRCWSNVPSDGGTNAHRLVERANKAHFTPGWNRRTEATWHPQSWKDVSGLPLHLRHHSAFLRLLRELHANKASDARLTESPQMSNMRGAFPAEPLIFSLRTEAVRGRLNVTQ